MLGQFAVGVGTTASLKRATPPHQRLDHEGAWSQFDARGWQTYDSGAPGENWDAVKWNAKNAGKDYEQSFTPQELACSEA